MGQDMRDYAREETLRLFAPLFDRVAAGREKYPAGCTLLSLLDEAGEVAHAVNKGEPADRVRAELLDVAAVAMRLYFGEVDVAHDVIDRTHASLRWRGER